MYKIALIALTFLVTGPPTHLQAEMVSDSNTAYFAGERFDVVIAAPRGFKLITTEAQADGYACALIPEKEEYAFSSLTLGVSFLRIRGMSFDRAFSQDTSSLRELYGADFQFLSVDPLVLMTGDSLHVLQLDGRAKPMNADFFAYFDAGTDMLILEMSRSAKKSAADSEKLLRTTTALAKVLTRAERKSVNH